MRCPSGLRTLILRSPTLCRLVRAIYRQPYCRFHASKGRYHSKKIAEILMFSQFRQGQDIRATAKQQAASAASDKYPEIKQPSKIHGVYPTLGRCHGVENREDMTCLRISVCSMKTVIEPKQADGASIRPIWDFPQLANGLLNIPKLRHLLRWPRLANHIDH